MNLTDFRDRKSIFWILQISGWIALGLIYLVLYYRSYISDPTSMYALFLTYFTGFLSSLGLHYFYKKVPYQNFSIVLLSGVAVISSLITANIWFCMDTMLSIPIHGMDWFNREITLQRYMSSTFWHSFILGTWSALYFLIKFWVEWTNGKEKLRIANALAQKAQLQMLRYQLNPHFLFNALNSIRALVDENSRHAKDMITELSEFLRYSLSNKNYSGVPLKKELEAIRHYFKIEKKRFEEKLHITYEINPLAEEYPVLSFLVHPLVENAIKHGMQTSPMPLVIIIKADVRENTLIFEVCNSGSWVAENIEQDEKRKGTGTGLNNIKQRLENAFPNSHRFEILKKENQVCVRIEILNNNITGSEL